MPETGEPAPWMLELWEMLRRGELPTGLIVGTACISHCTRAAELHGYRWHLKNVKRLNRPRKPTKMPQPVWFNPF